MQKVEGIRKGYPLLKKRFGKLTGYFQLVRPFTLIAPLLAGILGVLSTVELSMATFMVAIYVGITLSLAQSTGQIINQYADIELDKKIKSYRPIPSGVITREEALGVAWLLAIFSIARAFTISTIFGLATLALIFFAVFYSLSPLSPRKIHPMLNVMWMAISRGFIPVLAVWSIYGEWMKALPYAFIAFIWVLGFQGTKDTQDVKGDSAFGIKTLYGQYGSAGLYSWMLGGLMIMATWIIIFNLPLMAFLVVVGLISIYGVNKQSRFTENNLGWLFFYAGLGLFYVLMFLTERFLSTV